jgi:hypothetical protein
VPHAHQSLSDVPVLVGMLFCDGTEELRHSLFVQDVVFTPQIFRESRVDQNLSDRSRTHYIFEA